MYGSLDISTSGMIAQRIRLDVASANLANADSLLDENHQINPWRARHAMFAAGNPNATSANGEAMGVHVARIDIDEGPPSLGEYNPDHPNAYRSGPYQGYIAKPCVNSVEQSVNAIEAVRAYEANVMAAEATKQMFTSALRLIA